MKQVVFWVIALLVLAGTFFLVYTKESLVYPTLLLVELGFCIAVYAFESGWLHEFTLSAFDANVKFIRTKAVEAKDYSDQIKKHKEDIDAIAQELNALREKLVAQTADVETAKQGSQIVLSALSGGGL